MIMFLCFHIYVYIYIYIYNFYIHLLYVSTYISYMLRAARFWCRGLGFLLFWGYVFFGSPGALQGALGRSGLTGAPRTHIPSYPPVFFCMPVNSLTYSDCIRLYSSNIPLYSLVFPCIPPYLLSSNISLYSPYSPVAFATFRPHSYPGCAFGSLWKSSDGHGA